MLIFKLKYPLLFILSCLFILPLTKAENPKSIKEKGEYRIMCLGESTTEGQWPTFLENILNKRNTGIRFKVIDKGLRGTNTTRILSDLEKNLDKYRPDMVIAMAGINDGGYFKDKKPGIAETLSTQLFDTMLPAITERLQRMFLKPGPDSEKAYIKSGYAYMKLDKYEEAGKYFRKATGINPNNDEAWSMLGECYVLQDDFIKASKCIKQAIRINPRNNGAYNMLYWCYHQEGNMKEAERYFKKAAEIDHGNNHIHEQLGWCYLLLSQFEKAENSFKINIGINPEDGWSYAGLGWCYRQLGDFKKAEQYFIKATETTPDNYMIYLKFGESYREYGSLQKAGIYFKKAIEINPESVDAWVMLGECYMEQGALQEAELFCSKFLDSRPQNSYAWTLLGDCALKQKDLYKAERCFSKALKINPEDPKASYGLGWCYKINGKFAEAEIHFRKAAERSKKRTFRYFYTASNNNYLKLYEILSRKHIKLVAAQYPMLSVKPLKEIFKYNNDIIFIDNHTTFAKALEQAPYHEYFFDNMFGQSRKLCTDKGNRLLAGNIADVLLKEQFR